MATLKELVREYNSLAVQQRLKEVKSFKSKKVASKRIEKLKSSCILDKKELTPKRGNKKVQKTATCTRKEALEQELVLYWNGTPCSFGHIAPRYAKSGHCKKCYQLFRAEEIQQSQIDKEDL